MKISPIFSSSEIELTAIRSQGPGGQNVNKVSSAIQLRFNIHLSSLAEDVKEKLHALAGSRVNQEGILVIKAQTCRNQEGNKKQAILKLEELIASAMHVPIQRRPTRPTLGSKRRRIKEKLIRSKVKSSRKKSDED
jgi:ribosome-associated protein